MLDEETELACREATQLLEKEIAALKRQIALQTKEIAKLRDLLGLYTSFKQGHEENHLLKIINGGIKAAIQVHGPITTDLVSSASKRVLGELRSKIGRESK